MIKNKKILVTGGLGFVGSHLVDSLVEHNDVTVVDNLSTGDLFNVNKHAITLIQDVETFFKASDEEFDIIFHFANCARIARSSTAKKLYSTTTTQLLRSASISRRPIQTRS